MALGIDLETSPPTFIVPDRSLSRNSKISARQKVINNFEQRGSSGINPIKETFEATFNKRTRAEIDTLVTFLDSKKGSLSFSFTIPASGGGEETLKVVCEKFSQTYITEGKGASCKASFRKVNIPTFDGVIV